MAVETKLHCEYCRRAFEARRYWQRFCSKKCQWLAWQDANPRVNQKTGEKRKS